MIKIKQHIPGRVIVLLLFVALLFVIAYKAVHVPITHDEKSATVYYPYFTVWQIMMYPDCWPSNHILNTLCIKASEAVLGFEPWMVRLHSILAFVLFFASIYFVSRKYFDSYWALFCLPFFLMFCNPFLLDFFGLARGYGLSNALMGCSVSLLLFYSNSFKLKWYYLSILFAMLAAYANFTLLIYWVAVNALLGLLLLAHSFQNKYGFKRPAAHITITALLAAAFIALCYQPLYKMQSTNQFIYWSRESFFTNTIVDQVINLRYGLRYFATPNQYIAYAVIVVLALTGVYVAVKFVKGRLQFFTDPLVITFLILMLVYAVNMAQAVLLGTPYLTTRTALSYYVLFAFMFMFLIRDVSLHANWFKKSVPLLLVIFMTSHIARATDMRLVREWWYDANTYRVTNYLKNYQNQHPTLTTIDLNTTWVFNPSFGFYCLTGKTPWLNLTEYHKETDTASTTLLYYAQNEELGQLPNYEPVMQFWNNNSSLLINRQTEKNLLQTNNR